jgi:hypothetical protein
MITTLLFWPVRLWHWLNDPIPDENDWSLL